MFLIIYYDHGHLAGVMQGDRQLAGRIIKPGIVHPKGEDLSFNFSDNSVVNSIILL